MSRDIMFEEGLICDNCGKVGAFDFMGDYYCSDCAVGCKECEAVFIINLSKPKESQTLCPDCRKLLDTKQEKQ